MNRMALMNKRCSEVMKDLRMQQPGNSTIAVEGHTDPQFAQVLKAFITNFEQGREIGAAVTVYHRGKLVIDLAGGLRDHVSGEPYSRETLQPVFSATKEITALAANMLADRGQLDLDAPVTTYWPEFAQADKSEIPVRWLLTHQSGILGLDRTISLEQLLDWSLSLSYSLRRRPIGSQEAIMDITA